MLCSVTASISIVVLFTFSLMVNFSLFFITIFSSFSSASNKFSISSQITHSFFLLFLFSIFSARLFTPINVTIPIINPTEAGNHAGFPCVSAISIAGIRSDHTEAAIITPAANPSNNFCIIGLISFFNKNTKAEP